MGTMCWMLAVCLFQLVLSTAGQTTGLLVESEPAMIAGGVIPTRLNQTVSLTCMTGGGGSSTELQWLRNGAAVSLLDGNKLGRSSLCVTPVTLEDQDAIFTCQLMDDTGVNASVTLDVTYAPLLSGMEEIEEEEEAELILTCDIRANPAVLVSWQQNDQPLDLIGGGFVVTNDGYMSRVTVRRLDRNTHQGTYACVTSSDIHGTHLKTFKVTVTDKTVKFPLMPMIAGIVVVVCTALLAVLSRWKKIAQCCK